MEKIEKLVEEIEKLTVIELADLVKAIEEKFGVSAAAAVVAAAKIDGGECRARLVLLDKEFTLKLNGFLAI